MYTHLEFRHYDSYTGGGCRVYENGQINRKLTAGGCGYDREGSAFGNWMMAQPEIDAKPTGSTSPMIMGLKYKRSTRYEKLAKLILMY